MVLGLTITPVMMLASGSLLLTLVIFQYLQGSRVIHFKGRLHMKIHKIVALVLLTGALFHASMGLVRVLGLRIG